MLNYIKELSDFGLLILIWLVQLIIYPSFTYMEETNLSIWHSKYTNLITIVVLPLMMIQIASTFYLTYTNFSYMLFAQAILIVLLWASTFLQAVPLHNQIESGVQIKAAAQKLVTVNWNRTIMWSIIVLLNFFQQFTTYNN